MKLHGNAALSWTGRRRLAERVVVEGWTLTAAARAAGVSVRCARKWVGRYRLEGERGLLDRSSRPRRIANQTSEERIRMIVTIAVAAGRARPHRRQAARSNRGRGRQTRLRRRAATSPQSDPHRPRGQAPSLRRLRVRARLRRRLQPPRLRGSAAGREDDDRDRLPGAGGLVLSATRDPGRAGLDRQRPGLCLRRARARLPQACDSSQPHAALPAANERQGRALYPHAARRLGLRRYLPLKPRTHGRT